jgi:hypothetical protein
VIGRWQADRHATLQAAYEKGYPGRFLRDVRPGRAVERTAITLAYQF